MEAVISISGNQYLVTPGQELLVHRLSQTEGSLTISEVLLFVDGDKIEVGQPYLAGISVFADVLGEEKGKKVTVLKFKAKSRYHKTTGFRPKFTKLKITSIGSSVVTEPSEKPVTPKKPRAKASVK